MPQVIHKALDINEIVTGRFHKDLKTGRELPVIGAIVQNGLNKRDKKSGLFISCDMGITERTADRNPYSVNQGRFGNLSFVNPSALNKHEVTLQYESGTGIRLRYEGANCSFESIADNKPKFKAQPGVTIEHTPTYKGVSIVMVLDDPLNAPDSFKFSIEELGAGFTSITKVNGGILLDGPEPVIIQAPWAEDESGERGEVVFDIGPVEDSRRTIYKRIVDVAWLRQATGKVKVDPYVIIQDGVDGGIIKDAPMNWGAGGSAVNINYGSFDRLFISNYYAIGNESQSTAVFVNLTSLSGVSPLNGKFIITPVQGGLAGYDATAYKLLVPFVEAEATWNIRKTGTNWATSGAQGAADRSSVSESTYTLDTLNVAVDVDLTVGTLIEWTGGTNYGVLLCNSTGASNQYRHCGSAEHATYPIQFYMEYTEDAEEGWHPNSFYGNRKIASINTPQRARRLY